MDKNFEELKKKITEISLYIARIPKQTKTDFINLSNDKFESDYGLCLKWAFDQAVEYQKVKDSFFSMNYTLDLLSSKVEELDLKVDSLSNGEEEKSVKRVRMLDGKVRTVGGKKDGK